MTGKRVRRWSREVTKHGNAMDLETDVFKNTNPHVIALSVKRSAERSTRRKALPFRSALSMLTFYVNRAGKNLSARQKRILMRAKDELRSLYGRRPRARAARNAQSRMLPARAKVPRKRRS